MAAIVNEKQLEPSPSAAHKTLTVQEFRELFGIDVSKIGNSSNNARKQKEQPVRIPRMHTWIPRWMRCDVRFRARYESSTYYTLIEEERTAWAKYRWCDVLVYACLIGQLIISSALIALGALGRGHHIAVAVLGATTACLTGLLSLIKGQGLPSRLFAYADGLRKVRDEIDFLERGLSSGIATVTYADADDLWKKYEAVRDSKTVNYPGLWTHVITTTSVAPPANAPGAIAASAGAGAGAAGAAGAGAGAAPATVTAGGVPSAGL